MNTEIKYNDTVYYYYWRESTESLECLELRVTRVTKKIIEARTKCQIGFYHELQRNLTGKTKGEALSKYIYQQKKIVKKIQKQLELEQKNLTIAFFFKEKL